MEKVEYKNVAFTVWDVGGQDKLRPLWRQCLSNSDALVGILPIFPPIPSDLPFLWNAAGVRIQSLKLKLFVNPIGVADIRG